MVIVCDEFPKLRYIFVLNGRQYNLIIRIPHQTFRLEDAITALKNIFLQQRPSASSLFLCQVSLSPPIVRILMFIHFNLHCFQVLCALTTLLIMIEKTLVCWSDIAVFIIGLFFHRLGTAKE